MQRFRNHISLLKVFSVASLLGIYIAASLFNNLHNYFHHDHHNQEVCSVEAEKDPCHQKVFHHNQANGCKHETHVYSLENKCELCDAILAKYFFPNEVEIELQGNDFFQLSSVFNEVLFSNNSNATIRLRGPPSPLFYTV